MRTNIEKLQIRVEDTKNQIEKSKELSSTKKMQKAKEIESTISKIKSDLDALRVSATPKELNEIKNLETSSEDMILKFNTEFKQELSSLKGEVVDDVKETKNEKLKKDKEEIKKDKESNKEDKKEKSWLKTQRDKIPDGGKKALKVAGGIVGGVLVWKGIKKLFGRGKEKSKDSEKKEGFWNHGVGKGLKWLGIGVGGFFGIKWLMKYFNKEKDPDDDAIDQYDSYLSLKENSPEKYRKYEQFGGSVNNFYKTARKKETDLFEYSDNNALGKIGDNVELEENKSDENTKGLVPWCMDNRFGSVGVLLSKEGLRSYNRNDSIAKYLNEIKGWGKEKIRSTMVPFLSSVGSRATFGFKNKDSIEEQLNEYFADNEEEKLEELQLFFKQYSKVLTYTADKNNQLTTNIAINILKKDGYRESEDSTPIPRPENEEKQQELLQDVMDDSDWVEKNIGSNHLYVKFRSSSILDASTILEKEGFLNDKMSDDLGIIIKSLDDDTDDILGGGKNDSALFISESKLNNGSNIDSKTKEGVLDICDNLSDDMQNSSGDGFFQHNFNYIFDLFDFDDEAKKEYIEKSGVGKALDNMLLNIQKLKINIETNPTKENINALKKLTMAYVAMKKEMMLAIYGIQEAKKNSGMLDVAIDVANSIATMFEQFYISSRETLKGNITLGNTIQLLVGLAVTGTTLKLISPLVPTRVGSTMVHATGSAMQFAGGKAPIRLIRKGAGKLGLPKTGLLSKVRKIEDLDKQQQLFRYYLYNGDIKIKDGRIGSKTRKLIKKVFGLKNVDLSKQEPRQILELIDPEIKGYGQQVYKYRGNKNLRKLMMSQNINGDASKIGKWFYRNQNRIFEFDQDVLKKIKSIDKIAISNSKYSKSVTRLLENMRTVDDLDKLDLLVSDQKFLNKIETLKPSQLKKVAKSIGKAGFNINDIDNIIDDAVEGLSGEAKILHNKIGRQIEEIKSLSRSMNDIGRSKSLEQIEGLRKFQSSLSSVDKSEIKIYNEIFDIEPKYFNRVLEIGEDIRRSGIPEANKSKYMKKLLNGIINGDPDLVRDITKTIGKAEVYSDFVKGIKRVEKVTELGEDIGKIFLKIVKVIAKIT